MWVITMTHTYTTITGEEKTVKHYYKGRGLWGMKNYGRKEDAKLFRTKKEARAEAGTGDTIEKI